MEGQNVQQSGRPAKPKNTKGGQQWRGGVHIFFVTYDCQVQPIVCQMSMINFEA